MSTLSKLITGFMVIVFFCGLTASSRAADRVQPGSAADPLVTRGWSDRYIQGEFAKVEKQITALQTQVAAIKIQRPVILLVIGSTKGQVGGKQTILEMPPLVVAGRVFVPLRFVGEAFGVPVIWDGAAKKITYTARTGKAVITIGQKTALLGGKPVSLDAPAMVKNGRTLVPLRFIGESLGAQVIWHSESKSIEIK